MSAGRVIYRAGVRGVVTVAISELVTSFATASAIFRQASAWSTPGQRRCSACSTVARFDVDFSQGDMPH